MELSSPTNLTSIIFLLSFGKALKTLLFKQFGAKRSQAVCNQRYINDFIRLDLILEYLNYLMPQFLALAP